MAATINPIKKMLVRQSLLQGKSQRQSLKDAGYSHATYHSHVHDSAVLKCVKQEILEDIKGKITVEYVLNNLKTLAESSDSPSDRIRANELLGKWLVMFTDHQLIDANILTKEDKSLIDRYIAHRD